MNKRFNKIFSSLILMYLMIPGILLLFIPYSAESNSDSSQIVVDLDENNDRNLAPISAAPSRINLDSGRLIFQGDNANITSLSFRDFRRETDNVLAITKNYDDLIVGDLDGNVYLVQGSQIIGTNPFDPNSWLSSKVMNISDNAALPAGDQNILYVGDLKGRYYEKKYHLMSISDSGTFYMFVFDGDPNDDYTDIFVEDDNNGNYPNQEWTTVNKTPYGIPFGVSEKITAFDRSEFKFPRLFQDFVIGTDAGQLFIVYADSGNLYGTAPDYQFQYDQIPINTGGHEISQLYIDDINHDQLKDIILLLDNGTIWCLSANKTADIPYDNWDYRYTLLSQTNLYSFMLCDLDNDGFSEIVTQDTSGLIRFYRNKDYSLANGYEIYYNKGVLSSRANIMKHADLDRDGDEDLIFGLNDGTITIQENPRNHNLTYSPATRNVLFSSSALNTTTFSPSSGSDAVTSLAIVDYNRDGWLDIFSGHEHGRIRAWRNLKMAIDDNDGDLLGDPLVIVPRRDEYQIQDVDFGDMDRDGDLDVVVAYKYIYSVAPIVSIYLNPGTGCLYDAGEFPYIDISVSSGTDIINMELYDMDFDNDLDIVLSCGGGNIRALENQYDNTSYVGFDESAFKNRALFTATTELDGSQTTLSGPIHVRDYVGDGYPDVLIWTSSGNVAIYGRDYADVNVLTDEDGWTILPGNSNVIFDTYNDYPISEVREADINGWISRDISGNAADLSGYLLDPLVDDVIITDSNGSVYCIPGQNNINNYGTNVPDHESILPHHIIYHNDSIEIKTMAIGTDPYSNIPVMFFGGYLWYSTGSGNEYKGVIGTLSKYSAHNLKNESEGGFYYVHRYEGSLIPDQMMAFDIDFDGYDDLIMSDSNDRIYYFKGLDQYIANNDGFNAPVLLYDTDNDIAVDGLRSADLDGDGDRDILYITNNRRELVFLRNTVNENIDNHFVDFKLSKVYSADFVEISLNITGNKYVRKIPILTITHDGNSQDYEMVNYTKWGEYGKDFYLKYVIPENGTYVVTFYISDQWGNVEINDTYVFYGDFEPPLLNVVIKHSRGEYVNGTMEIFIYNTTEPIGVNYDNKIGMNITQPLFAEFKPHYFETSPLTYDASHPENNLNNTLYYMGNGTWWIRFNDFLTKDDISYIDDYSYINYFIGINATDVHGRFFTFLNFEVKNDPVKPELVEKHMPVGAEDNTYPEKVFSFTDVSDPYIPLRFEFSDTISYLKWWVENASGDNVLVGADYIEAYNVGEVYSTKFQTYDDETLYIKMIIVDKAGNYNMIVYDFYVEPVSIQIGPADYFVCSPSGSRTETYVPWAYVHFKGQFIFEWRLRYDGLNGSNGENWTAWEPYDLKGYFDELNPASGIKIYFTPGDYGNKTIELQLRNSHETKQIVVGIIAYLPLESSSFNIYYIIGPVAGFLGISILLYVRKQMKFSGDWRKHLKEVDLEFDEE